jgi:hypothetical protein
MLVIYGRRILPIFSHILLFPLLLPLDTEIRVLYSFPRDICRKCSSFIAVILNLMATFDL